MFLKSKQCVFNGLTFCRLCFCSRSLTDAIGCPQVTSKQLHNARNRVTQRGKYQHPAQVNNGTRSRDYAGWEEVSYQYSLNGGPLQSINVFNGLAVARVYVRVIDVNGCNSTPYPVTINPGVALNATISKTNVSCNGAAMELSL